LKSRAGIGGCLAASGNHLWDLGLLLKGQLRAASADSSFPTSCLQAKARFENLTEATDTTTPAGRMMMQMVGAFAEFERAMLRERTKAGFQTTSTSPSRS
jgi:hypothetical protein